VNSRYWVLLPPPPAPSSFFVFSVERRSRVDRRLTHPVTHMTFPVSPIGTPLCANRGPPDPFLLKGTFLTKAPELPQALPVVVSRTGPQRSLPGSNFQSFAGGWPPETVPLEVPPFILSPEPACVTRALGRRRPLFQRVDPASTILYLLDSVGGCVPPSICRGDSEFPGRFHRRHFLNPLLTGNLRFRLF